MKVLDPKILPNWRYIAKVANLATFGEFGEKLPIWRLCYVGIPETYDKVPFIIKLGTRVTLGNPGHAQW